MQELGHQMTQSRHFLGFLQVATLMDSSWQETLRALGMELEQDHSYGVELAAWIALQVETMRRDSETFPGKVMFYE